MTRPLKPGTDRLHIGQDRQRIRNLERRSAGPWIYVGTYPTDPNTSPLSPPFKNGWGPEGGGHQAPRFRWLLGGGVEIQGAFAGGSNGTVAFTLPEGFVPDDGNLNPVGSDGANNVILYEIDAATGDVTIVGPGTATVSLPASGVTAGTYGDATHVAQITVDAEGLVTAASDVAITGGGSSSPLTTKGDIWGHNATADARIPVGTDGEVLTADSTAALGVSWKIPAANIDGGNAGAVYLTSQVLDGGSA